MFDINYTHSAGRSSNAKSFAFTGVEGMTIEEKVPPQAQQIIQFAYELSLEQPIFTLNDLIEHIEGNTTNFTRSKGGVDRIVRYYSKLMQSIGVITDVNSTNDD